MRGALFLLLYLTSTPPERQVVVQERESLAQIAQRELGDAKGASELKALNNLTSDTVPAGTTLKLPPEADRARALKSLESARNAVAQADRHATKREEASVKLREAEAHFQAADYVSSAKAADSAWALLSPSMGAPSNFQVKVGEDGNTTVSVRTGPPVRVSAENVTQPVNPGETLRVEKGKPPPVPEKPLEPPALRAPQAGQKFRFTPVRGLLGPVRLSWHAIAGARQYEVEVQPAQGAPLRHTLTTTQWQLPLLPAGRYRWVVRALGESQKSDASAERFFELVEDKVTLQVGGTDWK
jgi:LysM repeat protein